MFCENCGSNVDGMCFCAGCGAKVENAGTGTQRITKTALKVEKSNRTTLEILGYMIAFLPLLSCILAVLGIDVGLIGVGLLLGLWAADKVYLKQEGYTGKWIWWGFFFTPVYLYYRCRKTENNYKKFICNIVSVVLGVVIVLMAEGV